MTAEKQAAVADSPDDGVVAGRQAIPHARHVVPRRRLHEQLESARRTPITLISAPAGSGKTLLTASWLAAIGEEHAAWVTVRPGEADSRVFWRTVAAALAEVVADVLRAQLKAAAQDSMHAAEETPARLASLIMQNPDPILLVLDNLHDVSDADIHSGLLQLLSYASDNLRAIVTTRHDPPWPLHRMHLDGILRELRAVDLAFDRDEAAALFAQMDVAVSGDQLDRLMIRTEGWAAGLRLAALGVAGAQDPARFIEDFSGDEYSVADYLLREVFDKQPPDWQDFLIRISIVDEVCGDLADTLTGRADGAERLMRLAEANMFVHALGRSGGWYRLHHLLVDFLAARLTDPRLRRDLDRRAAEWFRSREMPWPALHYALAGGHWGLAADLVSIHVAAFVARQPPGRLNALLAPLPREVLLVYPGLALGLAAARAMAGDLSEVHELTDLVRGHLSQLTGKRRRRFEVVLDALEIPRFRLAGDLTGALEACRRVPTDPLTLAGTGLQSWDIVRTVALSNMGTSEVWIGDFRGAREHLRLAAQAAQQGGVLLPRVNAQAHAALLDWICGDLNQATEMARRTVAEASQAGMPFVLQAVCAYLALAGVATDRCELDAAHQWLDLAQGAAIEPHVILALAVMRARGDALRGQFDTAVATIRTARETVLDRPMPPAVLDRAILTEADLLRQADARADAQRVAASVADTSSWPAIQYRVNFALDEGKMPAESPESWPQPSSLREIVEQKVIGARLAIAHGEEDAALELLEHALTTAAPQMLRSVFVQHSPRLAPLLLARLERGTRVTEFAIDLLNRTTGTRTPSPQPRSLIVVPLTDRETIMLRYLASTLSNAEIARALYVSGNTVKTHQRALYRKLAVNDRRAAVARGREIGVL